MADSTYVITMPLEIDTKNARANLEEQFASFKEEIEGEILKIRITAQPKDLDRIRDSLKSLSASDVSKISLSVDRANFDKQLKSLNDFADKTASQIGTTFRKNVQGGFSALSLDDLIKSKTGKKYSQGRAKEVIEELTKVAATPITPETDYITIARTAEAYEQLSHAIKDFKSKHPKDFAKLGYDAKEIEESVKAFYSQIGQIMTDSGTRERFGSEILSSFETLKSNLNQMMTAILDDAKKMAGGIGDGLADGFTEGVQASIKQIDKDMADLEAKLQEARSKLEELQTKKAKQPNYKATVDGNIIPIDTLIQEQEEQIDSLTSQIEKINKKKQDLINGNGGETGTAIGGGVGGTDISAITAEIDELTKQIDESIKKVEEAKAKLAELKAGKAPTTDDLFKQINQEYDAIDRNASDSEIETAQKHILDLVATYQEAGGRLSRFKDEIQDDISTWVSDFDYDGNLLKLQVIDENAVKEQEDLISRIEASIESLQSKKQRLIKQKTEAELNVNGSVGAKKEMGEISGTSAEDINNLVKTLQNLVDQIDIVVTAFKELNSISGFQTIIQQLNDLGTEISRIIFGMEEFKNVVKGIDFNATFNLNGLGKNATDKAMQSATQSIEVLTRYKRAYEELMDLLTSGSNSLSVFQGNGKLFSQFQEAADLINQDSRASQISGYKQMIEVLKEAATLKGVDLSGWTGSFEKAAKESDDLFGRMLSGADDLEKAYSIFSGVPRGGNQTINYNADIQQLLENVEKLQSLFAKGFGISDDKESISYFQRLIDIIQKTVDAFRDMMNIQDGEKLTVGSPDGATAFESFKQSLEAIRQVFSGEEAILDSFITKISNEIPQAVDIKTQAFRSEQVEVENLIDLEIGKIRELAETLENAFKNIDGGENLKQIFNGIDNLKFSKTNIKNIQEFTAHVSDLINQLKELSQVEFSQETLSSFNEILSHSKELENLAKILSESREKIKEATKEAEKAAKAEKTKRSNSMFGTELERFTPESDGWDKFLEKAKATNIELTNIDTVFRHLRKDADGNVLESFVVTDRQGNRKTIGANSDGIIGAKDATVESVLKQLRDAEKIIGKFDKVKGFMEIGDVSAQYDEAIQGLERLVKAGILAQDEIDNLNKKMDESKARANTRLTDEAFAENERINKKAKEAQQKAKKAQADAAAQQQKQDAANQAAEARQQKALIDELVKSYSQLYTLEQNGAKDEADALRERQKLLEKQIDWAKVSEKDLRRTTDAETAYKAKRTNADNKEREKQAKVQTKEEVDDYEKSLKLYRDLYEKQQKSLIENGKGGIFSTEDQERMAELYDKLIAKQREWSDAQENGAELTQKQQEYLKGVENVQNNVTSSLLKGETNRISNDLDSQITKMERQSSWRTDSWQDELKKYQVQIKDIKEQLSNIDLSSPEAISQLNDIIDKYEELRTAMQATQKSDEFRPVRAEFQKGMLAEVETWANSNKDAARAFADELDEIRAKISEVSSEAEAANIKSMFSGVKAEAEKQGLTGKSLFDRFKDQFKNTMTSLATYYLSFQDFIRYGREAVAVVKEFDDALTEVRKVSSESLGSLHKWQQDTFGQAAEVGGNALQIQQSTAAWLRLGKSFEEAQEASQASVKLLNTTEFDNIEDATTSLLSITQAYKDLTYDDVIDKLNMVGDHFSSSSEDLSRGLQNAAAVLSTQGNDIDKALALLTAGNDITQDISKTSAGVRTIALRISGTEEAKNEIADMGEDVDDFVVRTKSKTDQIIRSYTAVASNMYKGVSVLDPNGNLRDTYDILLDIAKIYEEIKAEDKKAGTNRAQALVEELAGKNRSNILASILQNADILENAYSASQNAAGTGQRELDIYLDSLSAKIEQFKNKLQELAAITIDSDWLKAIVDMGTQALEIINSLVKSFGGLNVAIGAVGGIFAQAKGIGLASYNKETKQWTTGLTKLFGNFAAKQPPSEISSFISGRDLDANLLAGIGKEGGSVLKNLGVSEWSAIPKGLQDYISSAAAAGKETATLNGYLQSIGATTASTVPLLTKLGTAAGTVASTFGNMILVMAASTAISAGLKWLHDTIHEQEILIEKGKEAKTVINDLNSAFDSQKTFVSENADEYERLAEGVDTSTNKNLSLPTEDYEKFLELNNQLADMFPQLVTGFDSQGNAIIDLGDSASGAAERLAELLNQERELAGFKIGENLGDAVTGAVARMKQLRKESDEAIESADSGRKTVEFVQGVKDNLFSANDKASQRKALEDLGIQFDDTGAIIGVKIKYLPDDELAHENANSIMRAFQAAARDQNIKVTDDEIIRKTLEEYDEVTGKAYDMMEINLRDHAMQYNKDLFKDFIPNFANNLDIDGFSSQVKEKMLLSSQDEKELKAEWNSVVPSIISSLSVYEGYDELGENIQQAISKSITSFDILALAKDEKAFDKASDDFRKYFREKFLDMFIDLDDEKTKQLQDLYSLDPSEMTLGDYEFEIKDGITKIFGGKQFGKAFKTTGFLEVIQQLKDARASVFKEFGGENKLSDEERAAIMGLSISDLQTAGDLVKENVYKTWDELFKAVEKYKNQAKEITKDGTLTDLFNQEDYQKAAESYENKLSSLTGALETIRSEGKLSAEAMRDLREEFPDIGEITEESLSSTATDQLTEWVETIRNAMKDMSPEGIENANRYIEDLILSFGDLDLAIGDVRDAFVTADPTKNTSDYIWQSQDFEKKISDLKDRVGEDLNMEVIYTLIATDQFSGDADSIAQKYNDMEIKWRITVDNQEAQRAIDSLLSDRQTTSARNAVRAAQGYSLTREDYENDNELSESLISYYNEQLANAQAQLDNATTDRAKQVARTAMQSIMQNIYAEEEHIASNNSAMRELALKPYELALEANDAEANRIDISRQQKEQRGESDFTDENNADIARLEERNETLRREGVIVNARKVLMEIANKGKEEVLETNQDYLDLQKREIEIENERAKNNIEIANLQKENEQQEITRINNERFLQKHKVNEANRAIENRQQEGRRVDESMYQDAIDETEADLRLARDAQNKLIEEKNEFEREWYGEHPNATEQDIAQNLVWQNYVEQLEAGQDDIDALKQAIKEYTDNINKLPLDDLEAAYNQLDQYSSSLDRKMSNRRYTATPFDYLAGIATEQLKERNLEERIEAKRSEQSGYNIEDSKYWEIQQEIDNLISAYDSAIAKQDEFANSLINIPADIVQKQLNKINEALEDLQSNQDLKLRLGFELSEEDYDANIDVNNQKILANAGMSLVSNIADGLLGGIGLKETDEFRQNVRNVGRQARADKNQAVGDKFENEQAKEEIYLNQLQKSLTQWENDVTDIQNEISLLQAQGQQVTAEDYRALMAKNRGQLTIQEKILAENERLMGVYAGRPEIWAKYAEGAQNAENAINNLKLSQIELQDNIDQIPLTKLQNDLADIQTKAEEINALQSSRELRGLKKNIKYYDDILDNSKEQIKNLRDQNKLLRQQQSGLDATNDKWREAQQQIDANNSSIRSLMDSQYQWGMEVGTLAAQNIQTTIDTLMQALSEGRLSGETLTNMIKESPNFSDALFHTTTGQYVDTKKMWAVIEQQYDYQKAMIDTQQAAEAMKFNQNEKDLLDMAKKAGIATDSVDELYNTISQAPDNPDFASMFDLFDENAQIKDTIANLQAMEEELLAASSAFGKWQSAQSTANPSDYMQTIRGGMEEAKKLYDQGWWGKDDFTTFADLIATDAQIAAGTSVDNFEKNYKAVQRYLTEDISGVNNWIKDMIDAGYALETATGFEFNVDNMEQFAAAMGRSAEFAEYMLMALKDAGYEIDLSVLADEFANDFQSIDYMANDAGLQVKALVDEMTELANSGIDVSNSAEAAAQALKLLSETDPNFDAEDLINQLNEIGNYSGFHIDPKTFEVSYKNATKDIEDYAKDHPVELEVKASEIHVDKQRAKEALEGYQEGGNVDLLNRPIIDAQKLLDAGFEDAGEGAATVFTTTFGNELAEQHLDGGIAMNFTPILPDGTVMEARKFDQYCYDVIHGVHDDYLKLQIGAEFTGEDAIEQAEKAASEIHRYQDQYYRDQYTDDVVRTFKGENAEQELANYKRALETVDEAQQNNSESLQNYVDKINEFSQEDFDNIIFGNGALEEGSAGQLETTIDGLISSLGLSQQEAIGLMQVLYDMGLIDIEPEVEVDDKEVSEAKESVEELRTEAEKPINATVEVTDTTTETPTTTKTPAHVGSYEASVRRAEQEQVQTQERKETIVQEVKTVLADGSLTPDELKEMSKDQLITYGINVEDDELQIVKETVDSLAAEDGFDYVVKIDQEQFEALTSSEKTTNVTVDTDAANSAIDELNAKLESIPDGEADVNVHTADALTKIRNVSNQLDALSSKIATPSVSLIDGASSAIRSVESTLSQIDGRRAVTYVETHYISKGAKSGAIDGPVATGTAHVSHALGTAHALGTGYSLWEEYRHSKNAYARGSREDWALQQDENALVNEVGTESIVRDGKWFEIPGGAHVEQLKRGDIIFSAKQTEELKKYGKVYSGGGHGKIAYADGTAYNMINAYYDRRNSSASGSGIWHGPSSPASTPAPAANNVAVNNNTAAIQSNTTEQKNTGKAAKATKGSLDEFKKFVEKLHDWIEVRIERVSAAIDNFTQSAENLVGFAKKNAEVDKAMALTGTGLETYKMKTAKPDKDGVRRVTGVSFSGTAKGTQIDNNLRGANRYFAQAEEIRKQGIKNKLVNASKANEIIGLIQSGAIDISQYDEKQREFIDSYTEW